MKKIMWVALGMAGMTAGVWAQQAVPPAVPPPLPAQGVGGPKSGPAERPFRAEGDFEGMFIRWLTQDPKIAEKIGLTPETVAEIRAKVSAAQKEMRDATTRMQQAAAQQVDLLSLDAPDEAAVLKLVDEIGGINLQIAKRRMQLILDIQKSLTPEQRAKLREMTKARIEEGKERWKKEGRGPGRGTGDKAKPPAPPDAPVQPAPAQ